MRTDKGKSILSSYRLQSPTSSRAMGRITQEDPLRSNCPFLLLSRLEAGEPYICSKHENIRFFIYFFFNTTLLRLVIVLLPRFTCRLVQGPDSISLPLWASSVTLSRSPRRSGSRKWNRLLHSGCLKTGYSPPTPSCPRSSSLSQWWRSLLGVRCSDGPLYSSVTTNDGAVMCWESCYVCETNWALL